MPTSTDAIFKQIKDAQKKANTANLERYQQLLSVIDTLGKQVGAEGTFGQAQQLLSQVGEAAQTRIGEQAIKARASTSQDLISRGLGSTTIRQASMRGIRADEERARQAAAEGTAGQQAGLLTQRAGMEAQIGGMKAGAIEGRFDEGPDLSMFASLIQAAGGTAGGGGAAGGGGGGVTRTSRTLGPMAMAGRSVFGTPFKSSGRGGGGGGGGGVDPQTGRATGLTMPTGSGGGRVSGGGGGVGTSRVSLSPGGGVGFFGGMGGGGSVSYAPKGQTPWDPSQQGEGTISMTESQRDPTAGEQTALDVARAGGAEVGFTGMSPEEAAAADAARDASFEGGQAPTKKEWTWEEEVKRYQKIGIPIPYNIRLKHGKVRPAMSAPVFSGNLR